MALHDMRGKEVNEGDIVSFSSQPTMVCGLVMSVSPPMVIRTPQGDGMLQKMRVAVFFDFQMPANGTGPIAVTDKFESDGAKNLLNEVTKSIERLQSGSSGSSIIT